MEEEHTLKVRAIILTGALALMLGLAFAATITQEASAACFDTSTKQEVPCPKEKKPTRTPVPSTKTPTATATDTPAPTASFTAVPETTPTADPGKPPVAAFLPPPGGSAETACRTSPLGGLLAGLGLLAAGIILRLAPKVPGDASAAFSYPQSKGQGRVIDTAFGQGSPAANERLGNGGPVQGVRAGTGAASRAQDLLRTARVARLISLPGIGIGGLLVLGAGAQYGGLLGCGALPGGGTIATTGLGLALAVAVLTIALILRRSMETSLKYSMFLPEGTPTRASVHVAMKQSSPPDNKTDSSGSDDPFKRRL